MKILNLYAGIGGNRKLWGNEHEITAVEFDKETAKVYKDYFPNDIVLVEDAHLYLLNNWEKYDFIWDSPPCPTHSRFNTSLVGQGHKPRYADMTLYQEIIFLKQWCKDKKWVVENVIPYYQPLIPAKKADRHLWWSNFYISPFDEIRPFTIERSKIKEYEDFLGYDLSKYNLKNKGKNLRNCVNPETGLHILNCALKIDRQNNQEPFF